MYTPGQHRLNSIDAMRGARHGSDASVIDQCIAELMYSQAVLSVQRHRLSGQTTEIRVLKAGNHD